MATHNKIVSLTDLQQTILSNDLYNSIPAISEVLYTGDDVETQGDTPSKNVGDVKVESKTANQGLDTWIQNAIDGKLNNCWKRMQSEWTTKLMNDDSFTDPIPSNQADFVALVTARPDYKNRKARDDG